MALRDGPEPGYIASNMADQSFANLRMNAVVIADVKGEVIYSKQVNGARASPSRPRSLLKALTEPRRWCDSNSPTSRTAESSCSGGARFDHGAADSHERGQGAIHGGSCSCATSRTGSGEALRAHVDPRFAPFRPQPESIPELQAGLAALARGDSIDVRPLDEQSIAGYTMLKDLVGTGAGPADRGASHLYLTACAA